MTRDWNLKKNDTKLTYFQMRNRLSGVHMVHIERAYEQSKRIGHEPWCDEICGFRVVHDVVSKDPRVAE